MASYSFWMIFFCLLFPLILLNLTEARVQVQARARAQSVSVTLPRRHGMAIMKDPTKDQYFSTFIIGDPPMTFTLLLDLGNLYSWAACDIYGYKSTTFRPIPCGSPKCTAYGGAGAPCIGCNAKRSPSCTNNTCGGYAYTPWSNGLYASGLVHDNIFLYTRPKNNFRVVQYQLSGFPFACESGKGPLKGMSSNAKGVLTLANVEMAFHSVISKTFKVPRKFAICLPTTNTILYKGFEGALYVGGGPYYMSKENRRNFSKSLVTTSLVVNPKSTAPISGEGDKSVEYFINIKSIQVGGTSLKINPSLLTINKNGIGGTKLGLQPYTTLHSTIYKTLVDTFTAKAKAMNIARVTPVAPFGACYSTRNMDNTTSGPRVPYVDLILDGKNATWRLYGANLMVKFFDIKYKDVLCLGFVDGGDKVTTSIVIGGKQMEDSIVEIDLESSKVGVTSVPVSLGLSCSQFQSTLPTF